MSIDRCNRSSKIAVDVPPKATAQYGVDQQVCLSIQFSGPGKDQATLGCKISTGCCGVTCERRRLHKCKHRDGDPVSRGQPCDDISVSSVVTSTRDYLPALRVGKAFPCSTDSCCASSCH